MEKNDYKLLPGQKYVPEEYWNERAVPNTSRTESINKVHHDFMVRHLEGVTRIFELGPGDGRLFKLYGGKMVSTLDVTNKHSNFLLDKSRRYNIELDQFYYTNVLDSFPFGDDQFEIAVASQVLIHVPFTTIKHTIGELLRISESVIIISSKVSSWPKRQAEVKPHSHCFTHDYGEILKGLHASVVDSEETDNSLMLNCQRL